MMDDIVCEFNFTKENWARHEMVPGLQFVTVRNTQKTRYPGRCALKVNGELVGFGRVCGMRKAQIDDKLEYWEVAMTGFPSQEDLILELKHLYENDLGKTIWIYVIQRDA